MIWSAIVSTAIAVSAQAPVGGSMTLDDAVALAVERAFSIDIAGSEVAKTQAQLRQAQAVQGPRFGLNGSYTRYTEPVGSFPGQAGQIDSKVASATLSYRLDVFGQARTLIKSASAFEVSAEFSFDAAVNDVKFGVRQAYFGVLQAQENLEVQREALKATIDRRENVRLFLEAGEVAEFDLIQLDTEVSRAEAAVIAAENSVRLAKNALNNAIGIPIETAYEVVPVAAAEPLSDLKPEGYAQRAIEKRPDLEALRSQLDALEAVVRAESLALQPTVDVALTHQQTIDPPMGQRESTTLGVLQVAWTVFDNGLTRSAVRVAQENLTQAQTRLSQAELGVQLEVRQALVLVENALKQIAVSRRTVEQQEEALRLAQLRYNADEGILLEVTTAQTELTAARAGLVNARYAYEIALAQLQRALGVDEIQPGPGPGGEDPRE